VLRHHPEPSDAPETLTTQSFFRFLIKTVKIALGEIWRIAVCLFGLPTRQTQHHGHGHAKGAAYTAEISQRRDSIKLWAAFAARALSVLVTVGSK
jgi:hypothetical protein